MPADERQDQEASLTGNQPQNADAVPDQGGEEGTNPVKGTPPIGDSDQQQGQTQVPAAEDDVGVPEKLDHRTD